MKIGKYIAIVDGIDIWIRGTWYGFNYYWQSDPLFGYIHHIRKMRSVHEYGIIIFGLWLYFKIDK